jgi:integrase
MARQPKQPGESNDRQPKRKKSTYGSGSVYQMKDGRYAASIKDPASGKRIVRYGKTQKEAEKKLEDVKFEIRQGTLATGPNQTVEQYLTTWLEDVQKQGIEEVSYIKQKRILSKHIIPAFGHMRLKSLTAQHVQQLYTALFKKGYKPNTIQSIHAFVHKALKNAVRWKLVSFNVADQVTIPRKQQGGEEETEVAQALTAEQALHLLKAARDHPLEAFVALALITGMRHGELAALRWQDVDLEKRRLSIKWTVAFDWEYGFIKGDPKSKSSARNIQLPQFVVNALLRHRTRIEELKVKMGELWEENDLVFPNRYGRYHRPSHTGLQFHRLLKKAGLPKIRIHDLRHSTASLLIIVLKMPPKLVQELLGHSTMDMTMDIYTHSNEAQQREMMDAFDSFLEDNS